MILQPHIYKGQKDGPHILLLGRIHGNEPGGEIALNKLRQQLDNNELALKKGTLTLIPCCNPKAAAENKRFIDVNLNRIIDPEYARATEGHYEASLAKEIITHIDKADIVIDIHSYHDESVEPCLVCINKDPISKQIAEACDIDFIVCDSPYLTAEDTSATFHYLKKTNTSGILIEAGQNDDPQTVINAFNSVTSILSSLGFTDEATPSSNKKDKKFILIKDALYNKKNASLILDLESTHRIETGTPLYKEADGTIYKAQSSGHLYMKNPRAAVNEEYAFIIDILPDWPQT